MLDLCADVYFGNNRGDRRFSLVVLRIDGALNADSAQLIEALNMMLRPVAHDGKPVPSATAFSRAALLVAAIGRPPTRLVPWPLAGQTTYRRGRMVSWRRSRSGTDLSPASSAIPAVRLED
jgi:hypothetical protein